MTINPRQEKKSLLQVGRLSINPSILFILVNSELPESKGQGTPLTCCQSVTRLSWCHFLPAFEKKQADMFSLCKNKALKQYPQSELTLKPCFAFLSLSLLTLLNIVLCLSQSCISLSILRFWVALMMKKMTQWPTASWKLPLSWTPQQSVF